MTSELTEKERAEAWEADEARWRKDKINRRLVMERALVRAEIQLNNVKIAGERLGCALITAREAMEGFKREIPPIE